MENKERQPQADIIKKAICPAPSFPPEWQERYRALSLPVEYGKRIIPLLQALAKLLGGAPRVIAIDGRAASGKTTLASQLAAILWAGVIHMDDFFLPQELRTPARLAMPGGNVHWERFLMQVLPKLRAGVPFSYPRFDCHRMDWREERQIPAAEWYLVEGAYSQLPLLGDYMDFRVFSDISPEEQCRRIQERNGEEGLHHFSNHWIPMEEAYFREFCIRERSDLILP